MNRSGLPWCILYSQKLTPSEKLVFMTLKDRAYQQDKTCESGFYCYIDWLCANLNMSENTVRKALNGLREKKIINSKRVKVHKNVVNMWFIDWTMIDKVSKQFRFKEDDDYTEIDVLEDVVETPIEQIPDIEPVEIDTPPAEEIKEPEIIPTIQEEEMVFATTTVEDVIKNPELSFLLDENEITLEDEVAIAASRLSNINDVAQYYKEMNSTVTKLHIKYNVSKKYVDEMINNKMNKAA